MELKLICTHKNTRNEDRELSCNSPTLLHCVDSEFYCSDVMAVLGPQIYRVDRSKGRGVTRREIPIARPYRGPNQHGQKVSVTNFEPAQQIMRLNSFALEQAARNGNHQVVGEGLHIEAVVNHAKGDMKRAREYYLQVIRYRVCIILGTGLVISILPSRRHMEGNMFDHISGLRKRTCTSKTTTAP